MEISADWIRANADALAAVINATYQLIHQPSTSSDDYCVMQPQIQRPTPMPSPSTSLINGFDSLVDWVMSEDNVSSPTLNHPSMGIGADIKNLLNDYKRHRQALEQNITTILEEGEEGRSQPGTENVPFEEDLEQPQGGGCHVPATTGEENKNTPTAESHVYDTPRWFRNPETPPQETEHTTDEAAIRFSSPAWKETDVIEVIDEDSYDVPPPPKVYRPNPPPRPTIYYMGDLLRYSPATHTPSYSPVTSPIVLPTQIHLSPIPSPVPSSCVWSCWRSGINCVIHSNSTEHHRHSCDN